MLLTQYSLSTLGPTHPPPVCTGAAQYPRADYDGNVITWDKANGGVVNYRNFRSYAMDMREVTCMDCRTADATRRRSLSSRKMAQKKTFHKKRKLLFASMHHDTAMECCPGTDTDPPTAGR